MTASFTLALDTRAPALQWGPVSDANAGEVMSVLYLVDEPSVDRASLVLNDGRSLPMLVLPDRLQVELPDDTPDGYATVRAITRDDVWNEQTFTLQALISGVVPTGPPPVPPVGGVPTIVPVPVRSPVSRAGADSDYTTTAVLASRSRVGTGSVWALPGSRTVAPIRRRLHVLTPPDQLFVSLHDRTAAAGGPAAPTAVFKRPEGPDAEDELLLLGLL